MSETNLMETTNTETTDKKDFSLIDALGVDKITAIIDEEGSKCELEGVESTVGNVFTLVCKCIIRSLLGDEEFKRDLSELSDEEGKEVLINAAKLLISNTKETFKAAGLDIDDFMDGVELGVKAGIESKE